MMKKFTLGGVFSLLLVVSLSTYGQNEAQNDPNAFYNNGALVHIQNNALLFIGGSLTHRDNGGNTGQLTNDGSVHIMGDLTADANSANSRFNYSSSGQREFVFRAPTIRQNISGNGLYTDNDRQFHTLVIDKNSSNNSVVQVTSNVKVQALTWGDGNYGNDDNDINDGRGIIQLGTDASSNVDFYIRPVGTVVSGNEPVNTADGTYANDAYVHTVGGSTMSKDIPQINGGAYTFPVGGNPTVNGLNPINIRAGGGSGSGIKTSMRFVDGNPGTISTGDRFFSCDGTSPVSYNPTQRRSYNFTCIEGDGYWVGASATNYTYNATLHYNTQTLNDCDNNTDDRWRAVKAPTGTTDWTTAANDVAQNPNPCAVGASIFSVPGFNFTSFSQFGAGGGSAGPALPVELLYVSAKPVDNRFIQVEWATASETDNKGFEVYRSTDAENFQYIGWVDGNGTTLEKQTYVFNDTAVETNIQYYYQLNQVDFDGENERSKIVDAKITSTGKEGVVVKEGFVVSAFYENPTATSKSTLDVVSDKSRACEVVFYDMLGNVVKKETRNAVNGTSKWTFHLSDLSAGHYVVQVRTSDIVETRELILLY